MAVSAEQDELKGRGAFLTGAIRASLGIGTGRESIWSVSRPLIRLYLLLFTIQSGWLFWRIFRSTAAGHPGSGLEFVDFETMIGVSNPGLGEELDAVRTDRAWRAWYESYREHLERGEPFDQPPPSLP